MKIRSVEAELFHADGRTDRRTDGHTDRQIDRLTGWDDGANSGFTQFCESVVKWQRTKKWRIRHKHQNLLRIPPDRRFYMNMAPHPQTPEYYHLSKRLWTNCHYFVLFGLDSISVTSALIHQKMPSRIQMCCLLLFRVQCAVLMCIWVCEGRLGEWKPQSLCDPHHRVQLRSFSTQSRTTCSMAFVAEALGGHSFPKIAA